GRAALLVAQDDRPAVPGVVGSAGGLDHLRRLLFDLLAPVLARLRRDAAPLPSLSCRIPGVERDVVGRRFDPGRRLSAAVVLPDLVAPLRCRSRVEPLACNRSGVANAVAAPAGQFLPDSCRPAWTL